VSDRRLKIEELLTNAFSPEKLRIKDQSHLHAGHAGAQDGRGHFDVFIVSDGFSGLNRVQRHRVVYAALGELMETDIHAVSITAKTPSEQSSK
jgi:BolA protein